MELLNKVALVTGAASGIGKEIAKELLKNRVKGVMLTDVNSNEGMKVLEEFEKEFGNHKVSFLKLDVTDSKKFEEAIQKTLIKFDGLDILVNNAGIPNEVNYDLMCAINFQAMVKGTHLGMKYMGTNEGGNGGIVINISSVYGLEACEYVPVYTATKHGVIGLTRAFGHHYHFKRTGIRVVALCPSKTTTNLKNAFMAPAEWECDFGTAVSDMAVQEPEVVGKAALHAIQKGKTGSMWVVDSSKLYEVKIPERFDMCQYVCDLE